MGENGNVWKKWDLHMHTPGTMHNDNYKGDWDSFLERVNSSGLSVIGATDYYSIEGYDKIKEYREQGKLDNIELVLPNVELRLDQKALGNRYVNFHVIFDPIVDEFINEYFLGRLQYSQNGSNFSAKKRDLIDLGRLLDPNVGSDEQALETGGNNFKANIHQIYTLLDDNRFKGHFFTVVAGGDDDGINALLKQAPDQGSGSRTEILRLSDAVFSTNQRMISLMAEQGSEDENKYLIEKCGGKKPVFEESDAHDISGIGQRWSWVKSEPSFDGLIQTKFEPIRRVKISKESLNNPLKVEPAHWIKSISFSSNEFPSQVQLNPGLNAIIGGKSSGKSILLYELALQAGTQNLAQLTRLSEWKNPFGSDLDDIDASVKLANGEDAGQQNPLNVLYLPQLFINQLSEHFDNPYLQRLIRSNVARKNKANLELEKFDEASGTAYQELKKETDRYLELQRKNASLDDEITRIGKTEDLESTILRLDKEYTDLFGQLNMGEEEIQTLTSTQQLTDEFTDTNKSLQTKINRTSSDIERASQFKSMIEEDVNSLEFSEGVRTKIIPLVHQVQDQVSALITEMETDKKTTEQTIAENTKKISDLEKSVKSLKDKRNRAAELDANRNKRKETSNQKAKLEQFKAKRENNTSLMTTVENNIKAVIRTFISVGQHAEERLSSTEIGSDLKIRAQFGFDSDKYTDNILGKIDGRKLGRAASIGLPELVNFDGDTFDTLWANVIISTLRGDLESVLNKSNNTDDMIDAELHLPLQMPLDIEKDNDLLRKMSPGKRAIVVLELLLTDQDTDQSPILIDQPEDNLDNRSISKELVDLLRRVSSQRQVIMVTHNANLVVLSDADEVIVANQDVTLNENRFTRFEYYSGSLENSFGVTEDSGKFASRGIRDNITDILEGGVEAFKEREKKYLLK